jgi:hypothetical protein
MTTPVRSKSECMRDWQWNYSPPPPPSNHWFVRALRWLWRLC